MKIKLQSDFLDIYDHYFCSSYEIPDFIYNRMSTNEISKLEQFHILESMGYTVPRYGFVGIKEYTMLDEIVVYTDQLAHRGDGKVYCTIGYAKERPEFRGNMWSEYITNENDIYPTSYRLLGLRNHIFKLKYTNPNKYEWRSNVGDDILIEWMDDQVKYYDTNKINYPTNMKHIDYPLWAIDFVSDGTNMYAIDFNTAPQIKGCELLESILTSKEIYDNIEKWFEIYERGIANEVAKMHMSGMLNTPEAVDYLANKFQWVSKKVINNLDQKYTN